MRLLIILTIFSLTSCHPLFCDWESGYSQLTTEPSKEKIVGNYGLAKSSIEFLSDNGFKDVNSKLTLLDNGQFKFINAPDLIFDNSGRTRQEFKNRDGKWFVSCGDSSECLIELENVCVVPLAEGEGKVAVLITIGDGDECKGLVYEKVD